MSNIDLSKFEQLKASGNLPSPKGVALAIMRLAQKEDASMPELARIVKTDPAFVGRLIKAANSVNVNPGRPIVSVQGALVVLGMPVVRNMALGFSLLSQYKNGACKSFDYQAFWSGSLACALAFQALAVRMHAAPPEEAFSVGLLARVGELALATNFPTDYDGMLGQAAKENAQEGSSHLIEMETTKFAMNHRELTAAMLLDWSIPKIYAEPVLHHEETGATAYPAGSREFLILRCLALSRALADVCLAKETERAAPMAHMYQIAQALSIEAEAMSLLSDTVVREWREWASILNVTAQALPSFEEMIKQHQVLSALASDEAQARPLPSPKLRVLVVEDERALRQALHSMLKEQGYSVAVACDGEEGLRAALDYLPHMMVVDWVMPKMGGLALTRALRQTAVGRGIYVLVLTSLADEDQLIEAFMAGVDDYMTKPLNPGLLEARLFAGQRIVHMQQEMELDREEIRRFAAELAVTNRRLQEAALTDSLTGFPNRRYAMERMQQEWAASTRSTRPLACMVIDLDQFKQVNDAYGHDVGDTYLLQVAAAIRSGLRVQDVVCRTDGDKFFVICPDTDLPAAMACAERLRRAVEATAVTAGGIQIKATMSVGVAVREVAMADAEAVMKRADQGVYMAKQRGRNRVASPQVTTH